MAKRKPAADEINQAVDEINQADAEQLGGKPGRPPGSKTQTLPKTVRMLPACPRCGDRGKPDVLNTLPPQFYNGILEGFEYSVIERRRVRCPNPACLQVRIESTYR